jgi:hypothetical protein
MPFSAEQECFFVAILAFIVIGFQRGWRRELVSLVFVLLSVFLIHPDSSSGFGAFLGRLFAAMGFVASSQTPSSSSSQPVNFLAGPVGSLILFGALVGIGYYVGNKSFPKPANTHDRFIGIVPAVISGAFLLNYLKDYFPKNAQGQPSIDLNLSLLDPSNYLPILFAIIVIALVVALVSARAKKSAAKK